jgi:hypothetical protein
MLIDTDAQTVIFPGYTKLTVDDLWRLIDILDPFGMDDEDEPTPEPAPEGWITQDDVVRVFSVQSQTSFHVYAVVLFKDGSWACSCPDWLHRKSNDPFNSACKHITRLHFSLAR